MKKELLLKTLFILLFIPIISFTKADASWQYVSGKTSSDISIRIVGGDNVTEPNPYPWIVAILKKDTSDNYQAQFCGGSYIGDGWVLTAAHCFYDTNGNQIRFASDIDILTGTIKLDGTGTRISASQVIIHPSYIPSTQKNDIALVKLSTTPSISPITLITNDSSESAAPGDNATVIGWGDTESTPQYPINLMEVVVPIVSNTTCENSYPQSIYDTNVCAGYSAGGKDSCQGDSGGPLFVNDGGTYKQNGIVSWGEGCAEPGKYGVYTRVSKYVDWINSIKIGNASYLYSIDGINVLAIISDGEFTDTNGDGYSNYIEHLYISNGNPLNGIADGYDEIIQISFDIANFTTNNVTVTVQYDDIKTGDRFYMYSDGEYIDITSDISISGNTVTYNIIDNSDYDYDSDNGEIIGFLSKASLATNDDTTSSSSGGGGCSTGTNNLIYLILIIFLYRSLKFIRMKNKPNETKY